MIFNMLEIIFLLNGNMVFDTSAITMMRIRCDAYSDFNLLLHT